jgi:hypothetical protein
MKNAVFWDVALYRTCVNRRFGGTSVHTRSTRRHIPEDVSLHIHPRENAKSSTKTTPKVATAKFVETLKNLRHTLLHKPHYYMFSYLITSLGQNKNK